MKPVEFQNVRLLQPMLAEKLDEANLTERLPLEIIQATIAAHLAGRSAHAFVDDLEKPRCVLILTTGQGTAFPEQSCVINVIHVQREFRDKNPSGAVELFKQMVQHAEAWGRSKGCTIMRGASWIWRGSKDISSMWESCGYEPQSVEFSKPLKKRDSHE